MKPKSHSFLLFLNFIFVLSFLSSCGNDDSTPAIIEITVPTVVSIILSDTRDNGDASDFLLQYVKPIDETNIKEYRIVILKSSKSNFFNLEQALASSEGNYQTVQKTGTNISLFLSSSLKDSDGDDIQNGNKYKVRIISIATDDELTISSLSSVSNEVTLGVFSIKISYMGNMGVVISDGTKQVIIDGLHGNSTGWFQANSDDLSNLINGNAPWGNSDILMTTHNHGDHFNPNFVSQFLNNNSDAIYIAPPQARGSFSTSMLSTINPPLFQSETVTHNGITVEVLNIIHFNQFGNDFSGVQNYAFIVTIGGKKVMHVGDGFYSNNNYSSFNLASKGIDVLIIPTFNTLINQANRDIIKNNINPKNIIAAHLQRSTSESTIRSLYPSAAIFTTSGESKRY
jgi:L-ascorbate metabolism protein UlaG (beta-lactamase superfamily)